MSGVGTQSSRSELRGVAVECIQAPVRLDSAGQLLWKTPGTEFLSALEDQKEIRFIGEQIWPDRRIVFIVLEDDPDPLLDRIFETEARLMKRFARLPFDVRVMVKDTKEEIESLKATCIGHYSKEFSATK